MTLAEAIKRASEEPHQIERARQVREVVEFMRFRMGWDYEQCQNAAKKSGVDRARWEELLYEADSGDLI